MGKLSEPSRLREHIKCAKLLRMATNTLHTSEAQARRALAEVCIDAVSRPRAARRDRMGLA